MRIADLAYAVGFNDPKYFSTCFRKKFGISPKEFIEQLEGKGEKIVNPDIFRRCLCNVLLCIVLPALCRSAVAAGRFASEPFYGKISTSKPSGQSIFVSGKSPSDGAVGTEN